MSAAEELDRDAPVVLTVTNNGIKAEFKGRRGNKVFKNIGLQSLARVLNRDAEFDTGFLPVYGRHYIAVKRYIKMGDKEIIFIEASPANRTVKYNRVDNGEIQNVRYPGLLMSVVCRVDNTGILTPHDTRLYATQGPIIRDTDQLYRFPFANVYSDGKICWGSVNYRKGVKNLTQAGSLLDTFLSGTMNNDLYDRNGGGHLVDRLEGLKDACEYPYSTLRPEFNFRDLTSLLKGRGVG